MKLITKRDKILESSANWDRQYDGCSTIYQDKIDIGDKLRKLDLNTVSAKEVDAIIGNCSWTHIHCDECDEGVERAVELGEEPYYESNTATICFMCLQKATLLITDQRND